METMPLFVYGTLKRDHGNNRILVRNGAQFIGEARAPGRLRGQGLPYYFPTPGYVYAFGTWNYETDRQVLAVLQSGVQSGGKGPTVLPEAPVVQGELWMVPLDGFTMLDSLEGFHPYADPLSLHALSHYVRVAVPVGLVSHTHNTGLVMAWSYKAGGWVESEFKRHPDRYPDMNGVYSATWKEGA